MAVYCLAPWHPGAAPGAFTAFGRCLRLAALRVRVADGPTQRIGEPGHQHMPGGEVRLVGERRASGKRKFCLCNLPAGTSPRALAAIIKARSICEQAYQQLKEEPGLDHFEGRSWDGPPGRGEGGKTGRQDRRLNQASPPSDAPCSSIRSAHTAADVRSAAKACASHSDTL